MPQRAIEVEIAQLNIVPTVLLRIVPLWILPDVIVDFTVLKLKNKGKQFLHNPFILQGGIDRYYSQVQIYTALKTSANKEEVAFIVPWYNKCREEEQGSREEDQQ